MKIEETAGRWRGDASILVINDDDIRALLTKLLARYGAVHCAATVDEGMELFQQSSPGIVFTDYEMPEKNGIECIRQMKSIQPQVNIVMLTGSATKELIAQAKREGARECLEKPFSFSKIFELANRYLATSAIESTLLPKAGQLLGAKRLSRAL
ncbi:MAG: response regulator [Verrucomicrobia bacterium]|nr:response regulator [Verrucomicrobiota bacterium]